MTEPLWSEIAQLQAQRTAELKSLGAGRVRLSATRARFIAEHWNDAEIRLDVAFEVQRITAELDVVWENWKRNHPFRALFKSQRRKVVANLKQCQRLFETKEFYEACARGEYGTRFANYSYWGQVNPPWPRS